MKKGFSFSRKNLCIPYALFLVLFVVIPLLLVVYYAFTDANGNFYLGNFGEFFSDASKVSTLLISIVVAFLVTIICIVLAYPIAYILSKMDKKVAFIFLLLFITPMWINFVLRAMAMKELLTFLNVPFGNLANIIGLTYDYLPFMILPIYSVLIKMDKSLIEASQDLGAGKATTFLKITLPLSSGGIISGAMMVFLPVMSCYVITDMFSGSTGFTVIGKLIAWCFVGEGGVQADTNGGATIALIMLVIMFVAMWLTGGFENEETGRGTNL